MEFKVWKLLCLLLITCGSAASDSDPDHAPDHINTTAPVIPPREPSLNLSTGPGSGPDPGVTNTSYGNTTTGGGSISVTPEPKMDNGSISSTLHPNLTEIPVSQTPPLSFGNQTSNTTDPPYQGHTTPGGINASHPASIKPTNQPIPQRTTGPSKTATLKHTVSTKNGHNETFSWHPPTSTVPPTSNDTPPQRHMGGDTVMVHESPSLDPLLTGLVSAFIITAIFITLLLFIRRHRRHRSEFSRLQDVSMDDVMEDTPLAMYNY